LALLVALAVGCDGGEESTGDTPGITGAAEVTPAAGVTVTADTPVTGVTVTISTPDAEDDSTPAPTPADDSTPAATEASPAVEVTPIPGARLATIPQDVVGFLTGYGDRLAERVGCAYDGEQLLVDCTEAGFGLIQLSPPLAEGTNITCSALLIDGELIGASCNSTDPVFGTIYQLE
jgi:hypothetical protein